MVGREEHGMLKFISGVCKVYTCTLQGFVVRSPEWLVATGHSPCVYNSFLISADLAKCAMPPVGLVNCLAANLGG